MSQKATDATRDAIQVFLVDTSPSVQNAIDTWHTQTKQTIQPCATPSQCPQKKKPVSKSQAKNNACPQCIAWVKEIEKVVPHSGSLTWKNANPTLFYKDPLEVIKLLVLRMPDGKTVSTLSDFDAASLLMIMMKFKPFHGGSHSVVDKIDKVFKIRNELAHLKVNRGLQLDDQKLASFWKDIVELVNELEVLGLQYFTKDTADELRQKLDKIKKIPLQGPVDKDAMRPMVEDIVHETMQQKESQQKTDAEVELADFVQFVADDLRQYYKRSYCKKQMYPWKQENYVDLDKIYVPVTIDITMQGLRPIRKPLKSYKDIFEHNDDTHYFLSGSPGQGKSTFCAKLAFDWCYEGLPSKKDNIIKLLFIVQLAAVNYSSDIEDAIISQLLSSAASVDRTKLEQIICSLGERVVIVLDGLDEAPRDLFTGDVAGTAGTLVKVIRIGKYRECRVLVTTRPWREQDMAQIPGYRRLELQKMKRSEVKEYVKKLFEQDTEMKALGNKLLRYIDSNKLLFDCSNHLLVLLISWYWSETNGEKGIPDRISDLYGEIVSIMYKNVTNTPSNENHQVDRPTRLERIRKRVPILGRGSNQLLSEEAICSKLGKISLNGLTPSTTKIVFTEEEIKKSCGEETQLNQVRDMGLLCSKASKLQFFHKSGQEFYAGKYLHDNPNKVRSYLKKVNMVEDALNVGPVLVFASRSKTTAGMIIRKLLTISIAIPLHKYYAEKLVDELKNLDDFLRVQQFIELCLNCNFEADAETEFVSILRELFIEGKVLFYGISSKTSRSLAYFMNHCDPAAISHVTLRPVAHPGDDSRALGLSSDMFRENLKRFTFLKKDEVQQIKTAFVASNSGDLHDNWINKYPDTELAAYIHCIQAFEGQGLPNSSETDTAPLIGGFGRIKLQTLNVNQFRPLNILLEAIDKDQLLVPDLQVLNARSTSSTEHEMTRLVSLLPKMPLLRELDICHNNAEAGHTIPTLANKLHKCKLHQLDIKFMNAPAKDMEVLAQKIPSQLTGLSIVNNEISDTVATHLIDKLPQALTWLAVSLDNLSKQKHGEFLQAIHSKYKHLQKVTLWMSPYPSALVKHGGMMLASCKDLFRLTMKSSCTEFPVIPDDSVKAFTDGLGQARNIKDLSLYDVRLDKKGFDKVLELSRPKGLRKLEYARKLLPDGVNADNLDDFVILN